MSSLVAVLLVAQASLTPPAPPSVAQDPRPVALASASARPSECRPEIGAAAAKLPAWAALRNPKQLAYCRAMSRGYALLGTAPERTLVAAREARAAWADRSGPWLLEGRAELRLGHVDEAWGMFSHVLGVNSRAVEDPEGLHDMASVARLTRHPEEALRAYRELVARAELLDAPERQIRVYVEAAWAAQILGTAGLAEALAYLRAARQAWQIPGTSALVMGTLAVVLDRSDRREEARAVAEQSGGAGLSVAELLGDAKLLPEETAALRGAVEAPESPAIGQQFWEESLAHQPPGSPWVEHARGAITRLARNNGKGGPVRKGPRAKEPGAPTPPQRSP